MATTAQRPRARRIVGSTMCATASIARSARHRTQPPADRLGARLRARMARSISGSIARRYARRAGALCRPAARDGAAARRNGRWRTGSRWRALAARAMQLVLPWGSAAERRRSASIAAALAECAGRRAAAARRRGADDRRARNSWSASIPASPTLPPRSACRWSRSSPAAEPDLTGRSAPGPIEVVGGKDATPSVEEVARRRRVGARAKRCVLRQHACARVRQHRVRPACRRAAMRHGGIARLQGTQSASPGRPAARGSRRAD